MNRRNFLASSLALAGSQPLLRPLGALAAEDPEAPLPAAPHDLLSTTYTREFLERNLAAPGSWRPYPAFSERAPWEAVPDDIRAALIAEAEKVRREGWPAVLATKFLEYKRSGDRHTFEADSFGRRSMLQCLVLAECLEGKGRLLDEIVNGIWLISEETFWGSPAHMSDQKAGVDLADVSEPIIELFSAETAQLLAWTVYLLAPQLDTVSPLVTRRIRIEVERRILGPARDRDDFRWMGLKQGRREGRMNNWNPWINSNLLVTNLILEEDPKKRLAETERIVRSTDAYLNTFWPDAAEEEGPGYYSASVLTLYEVLSTLQSATGNQAKIFREPYLDAMGRFILNAHIAGGDYLAYGDAHRHSAPPGDLVYRLGRDVHDPELEAFGAQCASRSGLSAEGAGLASAVSGRQASLSRAIPAVLEAQEVRSARRQNPLPRDAWYPAFGLMVARRKAGTTGGMYVAVLASNNGRSHGHNDTGSYVIYLDGQPVAIDVGVEAYTARTFSRERYTIWTMQSAYHNLPTVGDVMQSNGLEYTATERRYETGDQLARISCNLAAAYPKAAGIRSWVRTVTLDRQRNSVLVEERFDLERAVPLSFTVMTPRVAHSDGRVVTLPAPGAEGRACVLDYDGRQLKPWLETVDVAANGMRETWGGHINRILLKSLGPLQSGTIAYSFEPA